MKKTKTAVLGAGPMGLMCALELLKAGHDVDIYERDDRIGGMSASFDFDGLAIERFYHFICKTDYPLFELLAELGLSDRLKWTDTKMGFFWKGRLYKWGTPQALLRFDGLSLIEKFRYALQVMKTKNISDWTALDKVSAVSWLKKWLGQHAYDVLWHRLFWLKFYELSDQLSASWLGTRIKRVALSRRNLLQESLGYLEGGSATLLAALRAAHRVARRPHPAQVGHRPGRHRRRRQGARHRRRGHRNRSRPGRQHRADTIRPGARARPA